MKPILELKGISKKYRIGADATPYKTFRESFGSLLSKSKPNKSEFWALDDISFNVMPGESLGVVGKNGAGKSTLLKILSRITPPTKGNIVCRGRIASLLEVGTGFHPELTGSENIFLNGSILGLSRKEIQAKYDEIVDFSGVEKFLTTPLKHFSSGMQLRLAFAVAAHLEPEILVIDEVLAVGDSEFQKKCIGKMDEVNNSGKTILFVSHNLNLLHTLCPRSILLKNGKLVREGDTEHVIEYYNETITSDPGGDIRVTSSLDDGKPWESGTEIAIHISWDRNKFEPGWECDLACYTYEGVKVFAVQSNRIEGFDSEDPNLNSITFYIDNPDLTDKPLRLDVGMRKKLGHQYEAVVPNCLTLNPAGHKLPAYKRHDVIVVPKVRLEKNKNE